MRRWNSHGAPPEENLLDKTGFLATLSVQPPQSTMKTIIQTVLTGTLALITAHAAEIGKPAPAFTAKNVKGEAVSLADLKGKVVVLEWVNYGCPFVKKH